MGGCGWVGEMEREKRKEREGRKERERERERERDKARLANVHTTLSHNSSRF